MCWEDLKRSYPPQKGNALCETYLVITALRRDGSLGCPRFGQLSVAQKPTAHLAPRNAPLSLTGRGIPGASWERTCANVACGKKSNGGVKECL